MQSDVQLAPDRLGPTVAVMAFFFGIAALGGLLRGLHRKLAVSEILLAAGTSGFAGVSSGLLLYHMLGPEAWPAVLALVSIVGWIGGTVVLDLVGDHLKETAVEKLTLLIGKKPKPAGSGLVIDTR